MRNIILTLLLSGCGAGTIPDYSTTGQSSSDPPTSTTTSMSTTQASSVRSTTTVRSTSTTSTTSTTIGTTTSTGRSSGGVRTSTAVATSAVTTTDPDAGPIDCQQDTGADYCLWSCVPGSYWHLISPPVTGGWDAGYFCAIRDDAFCTSHPNSGYPCLDGGPDMVFSGPYSLQSWEHKALQLPCDPDAGYAGIREACSKAAAPTNVCVGNCGDGSSSYCCQDTWDVCTVDAGC